MTVDVEGVIVDVIGDENMSIEEIREYVVRSRKKHGQVTEMRITVDGDFVDVETISKPIPFDRIRRITGYLVGTLDRFNNGKRAEVQDRVKHGV